MPKYASIVYDAEDINKGDGRQVSLSVALRYNPDARLQIAGRHSISHPEKFKTLLPPLLHILVQVFCDEAPVFRHHRHLR